MKTRTLWLNVILLLALLLPGVSYPIAVASETGEVLASQVMLPENESAMLTASTDLAQFSKSIGQKPLSHMLSNDSNEWTAMESGTPAWLLGVWGSSDNDVFAVGGEGTILHYDGNTWKVMNSGTTQGLYGVWGSGPNDVFAVGSKGTILHYNGSNWSTMNSNTDRPLYGVWGFSGSDVFVVGGDWGWSGGVPDPNPTAVILHYNGSEWHLMGNDLTDSLSGVWGTSSSNLFAVGGDGWGVGLVTTLLVHYDGSRWNEVISGFGEPLRSVWGSGPNDIFVGGREGSILHYDGSTWSSSYGIDAYLNGIWGSGLNDVFAVGDFFIGHSGVVLHYDGNVWHTMNSGIINQLNGVWGSGPNDVFAVGGGGVILHYSGEPKPYLTYVGSSQISGGSAFFQGEIDRRITLGDHVHLQLPFRNVGNAILTNAVVTITGALPTFGSVGVKIHNGSSWSSYQQPVTLTPSTLAPGQTGIADFWIYVTNPDPGILQAMPKGTWMRLNDGKNDWTVSILLEPIAFDIAEHRDMLAGSCLHHPDDPQIQRYAQYAAGAPEAITPPSNSGDPDTTEQAMRNLIARVNEEFLYDRVGRRLWRVPDTVLITEREDYIGQCRHFADLTAGLSRSLGLPARYVRGNLVQDDWPGAPHMWNEVNTGGGNWQMVDATNNIVFDPFNVHWAWADRYPLSTASILTLHSCNVFCIDNNGCAACRIGFGELFPGELYGLGQGCMDNVKPTHNASLANQLFNGHPQTDLEIISLDVSAPVFVTLGTTFDVVAKVTNSTTVTLDNLDIAVSPYLESGWDTPIYAINPLSHTLSSILPGQAVTVTWVVTPLLAGRPLPLQVAALSGDLEGVYEQLQNVNEPGTLPNLSLTAGCDQRTVQLDVPITLTAMIADEYLHVITDSLSTIAATVYATPTQAFSTTFNLAYCADCQHYAHTLTLPADAPIGRYQVEYTASRLGYESEHVTSSFFVVPALTMTLVADPLVLNMTDPMTLTAQIYDRGTAISQAGVYAEITTPGGVTAIPLFSSEGAVYTATLRPADLADSLGAPLLPGQWTIKAIGNYQGGMATAMQSITIRHNIYLPLILRNY